jgi:PAS domain S-box-containing protein
MKSILSDKPKLSKNHQENKFQHYSSKFDTIENYNHMFNLIKKENESSIEKIINNTSEIIFSFNRGNKIEYWNKSAEKLIGYKKKEVFGKSLGKLPFIDNTERLIDIIKNVSTYKKSFSDNFEIITKNHSKKIFYFSCSPININDETYSFVFIGKDITPDLEEHQDLIQGHSYLIPEKEKNLSLQIFSNFLILDYKGLYLSRAHPDYIESILPIGNCQMIFIGKNNFSELSSIETLSDFSQEILKFISETKKGIILIDGLHYLITKFTFNEVLNVLYELNEQIYYSSSILLLHFHRDILSLDQYTILNCEFESIPHKNIENIKINDELLEILQFIKEESDKNSLVSLKKIILQFDIVYYTATKRVNQLVNEGLVFTKKYGKSRVVHLTEKAKSLLEKRV